jgi:hypothetical protein
MEVLGGFNILALSGEIKFCQTKKLELHTKIHFDGHLNFPFPYSFLLWIVFNT